MDGIMEYWWKLWQKSWTFRLPSFEHWIYPQFLSGTKLSFGFWVRISKDRAISGATSTDARTASYQEIGENCIRVLVLEPGEFSDPLKGTLIVCDLGSLSLEYEALSYVWGGFYPNCYIDIDDSPIRITGNLDDALRHLRRKAGVRYIWADSVCIDQSNSEERSRQVVLMVNVYRKALKVNIWLGLANECSGVGLEILSFLAGDEDFDADPPWTRSSPELLCAGLNNILHRPYFQRIWVVQELVVAKELRVTVGRHSFGWAANTTNRFLTRLKFAEISPAWEQAGLTDVDMTPLVEMVELANMEARGFQPIINSLDIMHNMRHRKATDPRDMVFALINLAADAPNFIVDYRMRKEEIYQQLYRHIEKNSREQLRSAFASGSPNQLDDHDGVQEEVRPRLSKHI